MLVLFLLPEISVSQNTTIISGGIISGTINRFQLPFNGYGSRTVDVWLPEGYPAGAPYNVLYMQDGQMLFDSTTTWNKQEWKMDETMSRLMKNDSIRKTIVVAIWNHETNRHAEYMPQKVFEQCSQAFRDSVSRAFNGAGNPLFRTSVYSDRYLEFLVKTVKPHIDKNYKVNPEFDHTFIGGSSMGGMISIYALCEYPDVFGGAICLSTHWPGTFTLERNEIPDAMLTYLRQKLPMSKKHKIYLDRGTEGLDQLYEEAQFKVKALLLTKNYGNDNMMAITYDGTGHSEKDWSSRLHIPITFMLKP